MRRVFLPIFQLLLWAVFFGETQTVSGHWQVQNSLWLLIEPEAVRVGVSVTEKEIAVVQGGEPGRLDPDRVKAHAGYIRDHLFLESGGKELVGAFERVTPPPDSAEVEHRAHVYEFLYRGTGLSRVNVRHRMLEEYPYGPGQAWDISYVIRFKQAGSDVVASALLRPGATVGLPPGGMEAGQNAGWMRLFGSYLQAGIHHILTGYDHLLFVTALVFGAAGFRAMVRVIGCFTAAHTATLALAALGWVRLPGSVVEPVIAGSIVFVGIENCLWPRRASGAGRSAVAFGFGLIHGLGFAGGLLEAMEGLPPARMGMALAGFSAGVETGHLMVVLPLFLVLRFLLPRKSGDFIPPRWIRAGSAVVALAGSVYLVRALAFGEAA